MIVTESTGRRPEFPVHWDNPEDANISFEIDMMHNPDPVSPMYQSLQATTFAGWLTAMREFGMPMKAMHVRYQNYYQYTHMEMFEPASQEEAQAGEQAMQATMQREVGRLEDRWNAEHFPRVRQILDRYQEIERTIPTASLNDVADMLREFETIRTELWTIHFRIVLPMMLALQIYDELYADLFGGSEADAHALLRGLNTQSLAAAIGLTDLAAAARAAAIERVIVDTAPDALLHTLRSSDAGRGFLDHLDQYLAEFGHRSDLFDPQTPTWLENPAIPLASVRAYLINGFDGRAEQEAAARSAAVALEAARQKLTAFPEPIRQQFEAFVQTARFAGRLQEDHNFYIDQQGLAWTRLLLLQAGRRLVSSGLIFEPDDVFMFGIDEIQALLVGVSDSATQDRCRALVVQRSAEMDHARTLTPPPFLGPPPEGPKGDNPMIRAMGRFWGGPPQVAEAPDQLKGNAGSRGVATGTAFVAHTLAEATGIMPGQILVATTTMPAWTPFFGVAAAVVTESGGPLSHCAIVAREYGIPAVVGAAGATSIIKPGQRITVDGDHGIVRLTPDPLPA